MKITEKQLANLRPFKKEEAREKGRNGGLKSVEKRRELKEIREWAEQNLFSVRGNDKTPLYELLFKKLEQLCIQGNIKAIEMLLNYSGLKPIDKVENINPTIQKVFITKKDTEEADKLIDEFINE